MVDGAQAPAIPRQANGRLKEALYRQSRQFILDAEEALDQSRRGDRAMADVKLLGGDAEIGMDRVEVECFACQGRPRRIDEEIIKPGLAVDRLCQEKPPAGEGSQDRLGDASRRHGRQHGIEGAAAFLQNFLGRSRRFTVTAGDRAYRLHALILALAAALAVGQS